jgi:hypothetical protein
LSGQFRSSCRQPPASLTYLTLGENFCRPIDHLPLSLTHLTLGKDFNLPVDYLPHSYSPFFWLSFQPTSRPPPSHHDTSLLGGISIKESTTSLPLLSTSHLVRHLIVKLTTSLFSLRYLRLNVAFRKSLAFLPPSLIHLVVPAEPHFSLADVPKHIYKVVELPINSFPLPSPTFSLTPPHFIPLQ